MLSPIFFCKTHGAAVLLFSNHDGEALWRNFTFLRKRYFWSTHKPPFKTILTGRERRLESRRVLEVLVIVKSLSADRLTKLVITLLSPVCLSSQLSNKMQVHSTLDRWCRHHLSELWPLTVNCELWSSLSLTVPMLQSP